MSSSPIIDVVAIGSMRNTPSQPDERRSPLRSSVYEEVFRIEEILHEIFKHLARVGEPLPKRNLYNAALVNTEFMKPALDVLWSDMHSLAPFFHLLHCETTRIDGAKKIIRETTDSFRDNLAIWKYGKRLRSLTLGRSNGIDDIPTLSLIRFAQVQFQIMQPETQSAEAEIRRVFPALRSVTFTPDFVPQTTAIYGVLALASPITRLEFTALEVETATFVTMLAFFADEFSKSLTHLKLTFPVAGRVFAMESLRFLTGFRGLRSLSLSSTNPTFPIFGTDRRLMDWILNLRSLEVLELDVRVEPTQSDETLHRGKRSAASHCLRTLRLGGPLSLVRLVLPMFAPSVRITELSLAPIGADPTDFDGIYAYVRDNFPNALNSFELEAEG